MSLDRLPDPDIITVYGVESCDDTTRARGHLAASGLPFRYVDLDRDTESKAALTDAGYGATPVVLTPDGRVLVEPSNEELDGVIATLRGGRIA